MLFEWGDLSLLSRYCNDMLSRYCNDMGNVLFRSREGLPNIIRDRDMKMVIKKPKSLLL